MAHNYQWRWGRDLLEGYSQCFRCCTHVVVTQCYLTCVLASPLHGNSQSCFCLQSISGKLRGKSPAQAALPCFRLNKPLYLKISDLCLMITLLPTGGKTLSSALGDVTLPSGCFQRTHTKIGAFPLLPFLQGYCPPHGKQEISLYFKKKKNCCNCPDSLGYLLPFCFPYG